MKYECRIVVIRLSWHRAQVHILRFTQMKRFLFNSKDCRNTNEILPNHNVSLIYTKKPLKRLPLCTRVKQSWNVWDILELQIFNDVCKLMYYLNIFPMHVIIGNKNNRESTTYNFKRLRYPIDQCTTKSCFQKLSIYAILLESERKKLVTVWGMKQTANVLIIH